MRITSISMKNNFSFQKKNISIIEKNNQYEFSQFSSRCLEFQALSNISFGVRPAPPIYLIDSDLNCKLYSRQSELAKELGVSPQRVSGCLNGRRSEIEGKIIVYNHQVEKKLDDGTSVLDKKKVAEIYNQRINPRTVYAMDYLGNVTKYENINKIESTKGLFIIPACDVESFDENGQLILDKKKIALNMLGNPNYFAIYSRDKNGELTKYENQSSFAQEKGVSGTSVWAAISGRIKSLCGYSIIPAIAVETVLDNGEIVVDKQKMIEYLSQNIKNEKAVYVVSPSLQYRKYDTKKELAEHCGMNYSSMLQASRKVTPTGEYIVDASEIEDYDEKFKLVVNKSKLAKLIAEKVATEAIYVIDIDMNIAKYDNIDSASRALNRKPSTVRMTLWKPELHKSVSDKVVVRASEIEIIDENGEVSIDRKKVANLIQERLCKDSVYLVDKNGKCKKFRNRYSAAKSYGCSPSSSQNVRINGYVMVAASSLEEVSNDGSVSINKEKVAQYAKMSKSSF